MKLEGIDGILASHAYTMCCASAVQCNAVTIMCKFGKGEQVHKRHVTKTLSGLEHFSGMDRCKQLLNPVCACARGVIIM